MNRPGKDGFPHFGRSHRDAIYPNGSGNGSDAQDADGAARPEIPIETEQLTERRHGAYKKDADLLARIFSKEQIAAQQRRIEEDLKALNITDLQVSNKAGEIARVLAGTATKDEDIRRMATAELEEEVSEARQRISEDLIDFFVVQDRNGLLERMPIDMDLSSLELSNDDKRVMAEQRLRKRLQAKLEDEEIRIAKEGPLVQSIATEEFIMSVAIRRLAVELYGDKELE
jgi:hypothetical protein